LFPDAPTERGVKHVKELITAKQNGFDAYIFFVVQMSGVKEFTPNTMTHPEFSDALKTAMENGVHIVAITCNVTPDEIIPDKIIPVIL
jgi:sugar fermentation stimulation protein A